MTNLLGIREQVFGKEKRKPLTEEDMITIHHDFMVVYGWIPVEEFKKIPMPMLWNLLEKVQEEKRKREELRLCSLKFYGVKHPK